MQPPLVVGRVLGHVGRGAAVLAAQRQPLRQAQQHQDGGRQHPHGRVGRQHADRRRREAHHHDGDEEGVLAADQIADAPEHQRAERPDQEPGRVGGEAGQQRRRRVPLGEEQRREERRQRRVDVEVVPLEDGAERRGEDDLPDLRPAEPPACRCRCGHVHPVVMAPAPVCARRRSSLEEEELPLYVDLIVRVRVSCSQFRV